MNGSYGGVGNVRRKRYIGYTAEGERRFDLTAPDACDDINPNLVKRAINGIVDTADSEIKSLVLELGKAYCKGALILNDVDLSEPTEALEDAIKTVPGYIAETVEKFYDEAVIAKDNLQRKYNNELYNVIITQVAPQYEVTDIREA